MPLDTMMRITSDMSVWSMLLMTEGVIVRMPWNRKVPTTTLTMEAFLTYAPMSSAATAGKAIMNGPM